MKYKYYILYMDEFETNEYQVNILETDSKKDLIEDLKIILEQIYGTDTPDLIMKVSKLDKDGEYKYFDWKRALGEDFHKYEQNILYNNRLVYKIKKIKKNQ